MASAHDSVGMHDFGGAVVDAEYHCEDFEWEELRKEIEDNRRAEAQYHHHVPARDVFGKEDCCTSGTKAAWQSFHEQHSRGTFFKERRYLLKEFPELLQANENQAILEVGCGSGSSVLPILRENKNVMVYACDCSVVALERAQETVDAAIGISSKYKFHSFYCDFSLESFPDWLHCKTCREALLGKSVDFKAGKCLRSNGDNDSRLCESKQAVTIGQEINRCQPTGVDIVILIFTLSAIPLKTMPHVIKECLSVLKPGGLLFFRDYGLYDMTMLRFHASQRVGEHQYKRSDGTYSYYFTLNELRDLFTGAGFVEVESKFCCVQLLNRKKREKMRRVWVHAKFQKPLT